MTDPAFIFALALGVMVLLGMLWISRSASARLSERQQQRAYAGPLSSEDEPDLFDVTDEEGGLRASREIRKRVGENRLKESAH